MNTQQSQARRHNMKSEWKQHILDAAERATPPLLTDTHTDLYTDLVLTDHTNMFEYLTDLTTNKPDWIDPDEISALLAGLIPFEHKHRRQIVVEYEIDLPPGPIDDHLAELDLHIQDVQQMIDNIPLPQPELKVTGKAFLIDHNGDILNTITFDDPATTPNRPTTDYDNISHRPLTKLT
jgi:hypothetical protein